MNTKFKKFLNRNNLLIFNIFLLVSVMIAGNFLRINPAEQFCPDWPTCYGQWVLPEQSEVRQHMVHRILAGAAFLLTLGLYISLLLKNNKKAREFVFATVALVLMIVQITIGRFLINDNVYLSGVHYLINILTIAAAIGWAVEARNQGRFPGKQPLYVLLLGAFSIVMIGAGLLSRLEQNPTICNEGISCILGLNGGPQQILGLFHRGLVFLVFILLAYSIRQVWLRYREDMGTLVGLTSALVLFAGQVLIGIVQNNDTASVALQSLHSLSAAGYIVALSSAIFLMRYAQPSKEAAVRTIFNDPGRRKDFLILNKPIIVALLLVTTYAGMVVGGEKIPGLAVTFWTLLGGAFAAGGSSAINQYLDRDIDLSMQRTAKRPLPAKRILPSEAFALGFAEILIAFFVYAVFVNILAAILAMAGMVYYVFIYSIWLKHATVQNIVIGGGAGAIPPLVGWAAATGSLNIPSLFLFALVFLWTPPHFWALALVRKKDYARANVPMLPVVKGDKNTKNQIFIYTIELVVLTLLMPLFGLGGGIYLVAAILLGIWLLWAAWQVLTKTGNKVAHKMYRYSSMYLAFIFLAMVVDVLV